MKVSLYFPSEKQDKDWMYLNCSVVNPIKLFGTLIRRVSFCFGTLAIDCSPFVF